MIATIFQIAIPSITSIVLFILAFYKDSFISEKEVLKERLNNLYIPFYQKYIVIRLETPISSFEIKPVLDLINFLGHNIQYMESNTQSLYFQLFKVQLDYMDGISDNIDVSQLKCELNNLFDKITNNLIKEYTDICDKLKYPKPVK